MRFAYYPGCAAEGSTPELNLATKVVAQKLGIELTDLRDAGCCGAKEMKIVSSQMNLNLNARILALAELQGLDIITVCNTCLLTLVQANNRLRTDQSALKEANESLSTIGLNYKGRINVKHLLWVLYTDIGIERLRSAVTVPLTGLKVAPFYGCDILRPSKELGVDDPANPVSLDEIIKALNAQTIEYPGKTKCCGFYVLMTNEALAHKMIGRRLKEALDASADCMVTPCPLCHIALDMFQKQAAKKVGLTRQMPVLHLPQLVGLALGVSEKQLELNRHLVKATGLFDLSCKNRCICEH